MVVTPPPLTLTTADGMLSVLLAAFRIGPANAAVAWKTWKSAAPLKPVPAVSWLDWSCASGDPVVAASVAPVSARPAVAGGRERRAGGGEAGARRHQRCRRRPTGPATTAHEQEVTPRQGRGAQLEQGRRAGGRQCRAAEDPDHVARHRRARR